MLNLIKNPKKRLRKDSKNNYNLISFRLNAENIQAMKIEMYTANFLNKSISFYRIMIYNPKRLLMELKRQHPAIWKFINRRKF